MAAALSGVALLIVLATWGRYLWTIPRDRVPARPVASVILQGIGMVLGAAAIVLSLRGPEPMSAAVVTNAMTAVAMGGFFLWLLTQRKTPIGDLKVETGDTLLPFLSTTSDGASFSSDELAGKRTLLKFFRGGW